MLNNKRNALCELSTFTNCVCVTTSEITVKVQVISINCLPCNLLYMFVQTSTRNLKNARISVMPVNQTISILIVNAFGVFDLPLFFRRITKSLQTSWSPAGCQSPFRLAEPQLLYHQPPLPVKVHSL